MGTKDNVAVCMKCRIDG